VRVLVAVVLLLLSAAPVGSASLVDEVARAATTYHEAPQRIDDVRAALEARLASSEDGPHLVAASRANFLWAEFRAPNSDDKIAAYERGRELADRARQLAPRDPGAHFWWAVNTGRWSEAKGAWRALGLLRSLRQEVELVLALDPGYVDAYAFLGTMYRRLPWFLGGDNARAETMYRKGLALDPAYTGIRVGLAKTLIATGRTAEARGELQRVVNEKAPRNRAQWTLENAPEAAKLLEGL
jgi:tetratricopeptide (TPR) repeat protein